MKKFLGLMVSIVLAVSLVGCVNSNTTQSTTKVINTEIDLKSMAGEVIDLTFWHIFGETKETALKTQVAEFQNYMKDKYDISVTITPTSQSNYDTLLKNVNTNIAAGDPDNIPNIVIGYPDHFAQYLKAKVLVSLEPYINSSEYGVDLNDYIDAYMEENNQFNNITYSVPFSKSGEILCYNKTLTDELGIKIPYDRALTWKELIDICTEKKAIGYKGTSGYANIQYLVNYDSTSNLFINFSRQLNANYTTTKGELLITKDDSTATMVSLIENYIKNKYLSVPQNYLSSASYGSTYFQQQKMLFTIGSTAGVTYNIPSKLNPDNGINELFEAGMGWVPQFSTDVNGNAATNSVVQQGPNICILDAGTAEENLIAWLFIKYMTYQNQYVGVDALKDTDGTLDGFLEGQNNSARFALASGYFPVTKSGYNSTIYQDYVSIAKKYYEAGMSTEGFTKKEIADLPLSEVAYIGYLQSSYYKYDPAFAATSSLLGSASIRQEAGNLIVKVALDPSYDASKAINEMYSACILG